MIQSAALLKDLKAQLKLLQADLKLRANDTSDRWGARLHEEYAEARKRERTGHSWVVWRDNEVDQAAVAWLLATTFIRFCEDNDLLAGAQQDGRAVPVGWIAGTGDRTQRAEENLTAYFRTNPTHNRRDWLRKAFAALAAQPAGAALVDHKHNPVWTADISAERAAALIDFWRETTATGDLAHDFSDPDLGTRFLGDLYQDLSEHAKKAYALLQTPEFVEEFILDQTLTPALVEFGHEGLKIIDPTCGSGHFLLGAFHRLLATWAAAAPALDVKERVRRAMDSIHGVDLNPFAVAIARFRLTVAGLLAMGERSLVGVPNLGFHLAIGDSLLGEQGGVPDTLDVFGDRGDDETYLYDAEDLKEYTGVLQPGQYHVVVGNPPYITVKDPVLNRLYKAVYPTAFKEFQLTAPFMELFFRLAIRGEQARGAGYVGQITGNGFMKQEFGRKVIEDLIGGRHFANPVDLIEVVNTEKAHIPGHGTPTVILIGRRRNPLGGAVRTVVSVRGEPKEPVDPANGLVWREIVENHRKVGFVGTYVAVVEMSHAVLASFPWQLTDDVRASLLEMIENASTQKLRSVIEIFGYTGQTNADGAFLAPTTAMARRAVEADLYRAFVTGEDVRDYVVNPANAAIFPYRGKSLVDIATVPGLLKWMWPARTATWARATFSKRTYKAEGRSWWEWHQISLDRIGPWAITYPRVATVQHFALVRQALAFNREASFLQLRRGATEAQHFEILALLNSSSATFWLKQVCHNKGNGGIGGGIGDEDWEPRYEFVGTKLEQFPLPPVLPGDLGRRLDGLAHDLIASAPAAVIETWLADAGGGLGQKLKDAEQAWADLRQQMIFAQEELDWVVYRLYGLIDDDLTYSGSKVNQIALGERAFEVALARRVEAGEEETAWFSRHGSTPLTSLPAEWPSDYRNIVQHRLDLIASDPRIRLLERPEFKRRWTTASWAVQLKAVLESAILDRLEQPELWRDGQGPVARSVRELADLLRADGVLRALGEVLSGDSEVDLTMVMSALVPEESVPYLAVHRYKPSGLENFRTWQQVWALQRREDAAEKVDIAVPPKYSTPDFKKPSFWKARGKLDLPKERFVLYPDLKRESDSTVVLGWAGWDHRDQALALGRELPVQEALGAGDDVLIPIVAGLVELEPWVHQWHHEVDPAFGVSPAQVISGVIDQYLGRLETTREQVTAWTPRASTRGRRPRNA